MLVVASPSDTVQYLRSLVFSFIRTPFRFILFNSMSLIPAVKSPCGPYEQSLVDSIKNLGRAHRTHALQFQIISDCRRFIRTLDSNLDSYVRLK